MDSVLEPVRAWMNAPLPPRAWWYFDATRFFFLLNTLLAVGFAVLRWSQMRHVWQIWLAVIPTLGVSFYLFVQIFVAEELRLLPTYGILYLHVCLGLTYLAISLVSTRLYLIERARQRAERRAKRTRAVLEGRRG